MGIFCAKEQIISDVIELTFDAAIIVNSNGKIILNNSQVNNIFGYESDETFINKNIKIFLADKVYLNNRDTYGIRKDGSQIHIHIKLKPIKYNSKEYILVLIHDKTDEQFIRNDIYQYKLLFDSCIDLLCIAKNGYFVKVNKSLIKLLEYSEQELYSHPYTKFVHQDDIEKTNNETFQLLNGINTFSFENRYISKSGNIIWLSWNCFPIDGFVYASARDITSNKDYEKELVEAKDIAQKESKIKSTFVANISHEIRTPINAIIGMASLLETTDLTSEQNQYLNTITNSSGILLSIINNVLDISKIESGKMDLDINDIDIIEFLKNIEKYYSEIIIKNNIKFNLYLNNNLPKIIKGDNVKLRQIITNLLNNSIKFTEKGHIYLIVALEDNNIKFQIKDTGIGISEQAQKKLFKPFQQANSTTTRNYGGTGLGLSICKNLVNLMNGHIYLKSTLNVGTTITFEIPYLLDDISTKTHRKSTRLRKRSSIVRRSSLENKDKPIVKNKSRSFEEHRKSSVELPKIRRNSISIEHIISNSNSSNKSKSDSIRLTDSFEENPGKILRNSSQKISINDDSPSNLSKIVIVEDHKINQIVLSKLLEKLNYRNYVVYNNGKEAIDYILTLSNVSLIFMDLHMPIMDGYNCTKNIREMGIDVPIVALTANAMSGEKEKCLSIGMNDFMLKPIQLKSLETILNKYIILK